MASKLKELRKELREFFADAFSAEEFKAFLYDYGYDEVHDAVKVDVAAKVYFNEVVQALDRRGLITGEFFECLMKERSGKRAIIERLQQRWPDAGPIKVVTMVAQDIPTEARPETFLTDTPIEGRDAVKDIPTEARPEPYEYTEGGNLVGLEPAGVATEKKPPPRLVVDWGAGARAQLEVFSVGDVNDNSYNFRHLTPWTACLRPPVQRLAAEFTRLTAIDMDLNSLSQLVSELNAAWDGGGGVRSTATIAAEARQTMKSLGKKLFHKMIPSDIQDDYRLRNVYVELGIHELVRYYPWGLMFDDRGFLCTRNYVGRFLNPAPSTKLKAPQRRLDLSKKLRVLLIEVAAQKEGDSIEEELASTNRCYFKSLRGTEATYPNVVRELGRDQYHIIHFCGHGKIPERPAQEAPWCPP